MEVISAWSYGGDTSTRSIPTKLISSNDLMNSKAYQVATPPQTGVPVPGAKAGSRKSISKVM